MLKRATTGVSFDYKTRDSAGPNMQKCRRRRARMGRPCRKVPVEIACRSPHAGVVGAAGARLEVGGRAAARDPGRLCGQRVMPIGGDPGAHGCSSARWRWVVALARRPWTAGCGMAQRSSALHWGCRRRVRDMSIMPRPPVCPRAGAKWRTSQLHWPS